MCGILCTRAICWPRWPISARYACAHSSMSRSSAGCSRNQVVEVTWDAMPERTWMGHTETLPQQVVARGARNVGEILCAISNEKMSLIPNTTVDVRIQLAERSNVPLVPRGAVQSDGQRRYVFLVDGGRLHRREIKVGASSDSEFEVISGLRGKRCGGAAGRRAAQGQCSGSRDHPGMMRTISSARLFVLAGALLSSGALAAFADASPAMQAAQNGSSPRRRASLQRRPVSKQAVKVSKRRDRRLIPKMRRCMTWLGRCYYQLGDLQRTPIASCELRDALDPSRSE